ncbi:hypothetical protein RUND412_002063 [Rhizina undulata]
MSTVGIDISRPPRKQTSNKASNRTGKSRKVAMLPRRLASLRLQLARHYSQSLKPASTTAVPAGAADPAAAVEAVEEKKILQAPNRATPWAPSQMPRALAMVGPRFEQTNLEQQPAPYAAIELIHQQPVRWSEKRIVSCDGGGGPMGHPRIFINVDKPEIIPCGYCGLPFAHVHHKSTLEKQGNPEYPLS